MSRSAKIGDIVVRTGKESYSSARVGLMHKVNYVSGGTSVQYGNYVYMEGHQWRFATRDEIELYNSGVRDIAKLQKIRENDNYSVF